MTKMHRDGVGLKEIAATLGTTPSTIRRYLANYGVINPNVYSMGERRDDLMRQGFKTADIVALRRKLRVGVK